MMYLRDWRLYVFGFLFLFCIFYALAFAAPTNFPVGSIIEVRDGSTVAKLANELQNEGVIKSPVWFRIAVISLGGEYGIKAGDYLLKEPQNAFTLAKRIVDGSFELSLVKVTIPEGYTNDQISTLLSRQLPAFESEVFLAIANEGYMFPDTYFIPENATAGKVIELLKANFDRKVSPLKSDFGKRSEKEIITMASIVQAEVKTPEDMALVSGILWKRLDMGMALQVDPHPKTYQEPGLPEKPLNNPGLDAIKASIYPTESEYLYFLSGKDGATHYAKTLEEHIANIQKYL